MKIAHFILTLVEHENVFTTSGPGLSEFAYVFFIFPYTISACSLRMFSEYSFLLVLVRVSRAVKCLECENIL